VQIAKGRIAEKISVKLEAFLPRNPGYSKLKAISDINNQCIDKVSQESHVSYVAVFRFAHITRPDVKRTLYEKRHKSEIQNVETILVTCCAKSYGRDTYS
jgi:hypothetical protein